MGVAYSNKDIDWEDVEHKISIILRKFSNIDSKYKDDLAQELRIHAYYKSSDYYNLYRRAIDYWRQLHKHQYPEIPFFDLELIGGCTEEDELSYDFDKLVSLIREELNIEGSNKREEKNLEVARRVFEVILGEVTGINDSKMDPVNPDWNWECNEGKGGRINLSWLAQRIDLGNGNNTQWSARYKSIQRAIKIITEVIQGLDKMNKINPLDKERKGDL